MLYMTLVEKFTKNQQKQVQLKFYLPRMKY